MCRGQRFGFLALALLVIRYQLTDNHLPLGFPFPTIVRGVVEALVARHSKDAALLQLFGQWDDVTIEKLELTAVPKVGRIAVHAIGPEGRVQLVEQPAVPLLVHVPVLHRVRHVRRLHDVFNDDGRLAVLVVQIGRGAGFPLGKYLGPPVVAHLAQFAVENVCGHHDVHHHLSEPLELGVGGEDALLQRPVLFVVHEQIPSQIDTVLFRNALAIVLFGNCHTLLDELVVGNP